MKAYIKPISDSIELRAQESYLLEYSAGGTTPENLTRHKNRSDEFDSEDWDEWEEE